MRIVPQEEVDRFGALAAVLILASCCVMLFIDWLKLVVL